MPKQTGVRYIKLGAKGAWEDECITQGVVRLGFGSGKEDRFQLCTDGRWDELRALFISKGHTKGVATDFTNQTRLFFEDDGSTVWITFVGERLYWGKLDDSPPVRHGEGDSACRRVVGGWRCTDAHGELLTKDKLSGALTKLASYQGTSCAVDVADYVLRRIAGEKMPQVERAIAAVAETKRAVVPLLRLLDPKDFELLVDLVFSSSGWRRLGAVGKTQKTLDLDLVLPSTGERAFVQVKSKTSSAELGEYVKAFNAEHHDRMFFVFHTGDADTDDPAVTVIGPAKLAELVIDAGLVNWLIEKVS